MQPCLRQPRLVRDVRHRLGRVRGAGRAPSAAAGDSPSEGRRVTGPMSLLRATAATYRLSNMDLRPR